MTRLLGKKKKRKENGGEFRKDVNSKISYLSSVPLRGSEAAGAEEVSDGARGWKLHVSRIKHHAEIFGDNCRLSAVFHLVLI